MSEESTNTQEAIEDPLAALKKRADLMGIQYHPSIGLDKLREKINTALGQPNTAVSPAPSDPVSQATDPVPETESQRRKRLRLQATALVRVRITCMNPAKKEWDGEILTTGNSTVGTIKRFIPFHAEEGWHIERMLLEVLRNKQCQIFVNQKTVNGITVRKGKLIREFAVEVLPDLTKEELHELAQRQAMAAGGDLK